MKLVWDKRPTDTNARNSEGAFIRQPDGAVLFAYSCYNGDDHRDNASCDIAVIRSFDEGESWSEPEIIVRADAFGVQNIMSVSTIVQKDGAVGVYFLIKENLGNNTIGRAISKDGYTFTAERCVMDAPLSGYVINNDRFIRLQNGQIATAAAMHAFYSDSSGRIDPFATSVAFLSDDDGKTFTIANPRLTVSKTTPDKRGMIEPGLIQHADGTVRLWARTRECWQYEAFSRDNLNTFTAPCASVFTSPDAPMQMKAHDSITYAVYNPIPQYNARAESRAGWGRTPLVVRKSTDDGKTWGVPIVIEDDPQRGFCYPAVFFTKDNAMLCGYCRGGANEETTCLQRLGIMKIGLDEI